MTLLDAVARQKAAGEWPEIEKDGVVLTEKEYREMDKLGWLVNVYRPKSDHRFDEFYDYVGGDGRRDNRFKVACLISPDLELAYTLLVRKDEIEP